MDEERIRLYVYGESMRPCLRSGDEAELDLSGQDAPRAGDIVLIRQEGRFLLHRLLAIYGTGREKRYLTRGDNAPRADRPVAGRDLLGKLVALRRQGRRFSFDCGWRRKLGRILAALSRTELFLRTQKERSTALLRRTFLFFAGTRPDNHDKRKKGL